MSRDSAAPIAENEVLKVIDTAVFRRVQSFSRADDAVFYNFNG